MAFGGFGGSNNNSGGFGGFGSSSGGGFGSNNNTSSGGSLFGGNTSTAGGFGGFGSASANNNSMFGGNKPAFGASNATTTAAGGSLFGGNTSTSGGFGGGGGFGNSTNTGGFGGSGNSGAFGQNKPATGGFGAPSTGGSLFGSTGGSGGGFGSNAGNSANNNAFGSANQSSGFGVSTSNTGGAFGGFANNIATNNNSGTSVQPFTAFQEKDTGTNQSQSYQSLTFMQPYQNQSFEELRLQDYAQGRRYGNPNTGQAGGFGTSSGFGGNFGSNANNNTGGGLFGSNNNSSNNNAATSGFGGGGGGGGGGGSAFGSNATTSGFGNNSTGSIFGGNQNKPTGGSLFSSGNNTGGFGSASGSGTVFGNNAAAGGGGGGGFGGNANANPGNSLFGNNQANQNKSPFGGFGGTSNTNSAFGGNANTNTNPFGGSNTNTNTGSGLFGSNTQQQNNAFGANNNSGAGLFGSQNKPAGTGFGAANNSNTGGIFGGQNNQTQSNSLFGASSNTGNSLFGNQNQNKPGGTGLFGSTNNANSGGSLFGANNQQPSGSSLFGASNTNNSLFGSQNKPAGTGMFGSTPAANTNSGFLGSQNSQQNTGSSLFGASNQNQQGASSNSLFGGLSQSQQPAGQSQLHASLTNAPYGNEQLFSSLAAPSPPVGPLATPLQGAKPPPKKVQSLLASAKVTSPVYTPRANSLGRSSGYGFSYSTYGTPGSAVTSGSLTPGASSLMKPTGSFNSALTGRLNKSLSTSNLRLDSTPETPSLLRPGPFASVSRGGSMRRLKIDRNLRSDLFGPEPTQNEQGRDDDDTALRKRVSFHREPEATKTPQPSAENALVRTENDEDDSPGLLRSGPVDKSAPAGPEMEQVSGALSAVPEDNETPRASATTGAKPSAPKTSTGEVGDYWTKPSMKDLLNMSRHKLQNVGNFTVGRHGVGHIEFGNVDLTSTPLEDICGTIVQLNPRMATVYADDYDKPSVGRALNVPSTIHLENSWPRSHGGKKAVTEKSGKDYEKHVARLKRVGGTHFVDYDPTTGVWSFKVDHFTTYGLDDEDGDETDYADDTQLAEDTSGLTDPPETPTDQREITMGSVETGEPDDTFEWKQNQRSLISLPGEFEVHDAAQPYNESNADIFMQDDRAVFDGPNELEMDDPFTSPGGAVRAPSPGAVERYHSSMIEDDHEASATELEAPEQDMPGSFTQEPYGLRSILKPSAGPDLLHSPDKLANDTWEEQLQRTMSPKKRDRQALRDMQHSLLSERVNDKPTFQSPIKHSLFGKSALGESYLAEKSAQRAASKKGVTISETGEVGKSQAFRTAMDLMDSMYSQGKGNKRTADVKGLKYPYPKRLAFSSPDDPQLNEWHDCVKPSFATSHEILTYATPGSAPIVSGDLTEALRPLVGEHHDVRFVKPAPAQDINVGSIQAHKDMTKYDTHYEFPFAQTRHNVKFVALADEINTVGASDLELREKHLLHLCSILFDPLEAACGEYMEGVPAAQLKDLTEQIRLDTLRAFWTQLVKPSSRAGLKRARNGEEGALMLLSMGDVEGACEQLVDARDFKLATLVSQLPTSKKSRSLVKKQIETWRERNEWSEMSDAVRALYSIVAGELCIVAGKSGSGEDRVQQFCIAEKYGFTWQQSYALRLFFGGKPEIKNATWDYLDDLEQGREHVGSTTSDPKANHPKDTTMELLKLFAHTADVSVLCDPFVVSGSSTNSRLAWQLLTVFTAQKHIEVDDDVYDQLTLNFAAELECADNRISSAWALLHIRNNDSRSRAMVGLLERNADRISTPGLPETLDDPAVGKGSFEWLTEDLRIPPVPIWRAKALWAFAGLHNTFLQTNFLLRAGDVEYAHDVLLSSVGPKAVIQRDYETLQATIAIFDGANLRPSVGWDRGGRVYADFLRVERALAKGRMERGDHNAMTRLRATLSSGGIGEGRTASKTSLEERVAITEMVAVLDRAERELGEESREADTVMGGTGHFEGGFANGELDGDVGWRGREMLGRYQRAMGAAA